jgi:hypothetical protein
VIVESENAFAFIPPEMPAIVLTPFYTGCPALIRSPDRCKHTGNVVHLIGIYDIRVFE